MVQTDCGDAGIVNFRPLIWPVPVCLASRNTHSPKLWMDAWLAAFDRCAGFQLITIDKAFTQFKRLDLLVLKVK